MILTHTHTHKRKGNNNKKQFLCSEFFTADETQLLHVHPSFTISVAYWECFLG